MKTQAYFLHKTGNAEFAFSLREFQLPSLKDHEILIEVEAFGLNYADVMARRGLYGDAPPLPCVLGYEVVGRVTAVGSSCNSETVGKRVMAFTRFGAYAQHAITPEDAVIFVADQPAEELLALCTQGVTAYYMACYLAPVRAGETVLIHAAGGGVGSLLIQLCKLRGARVIAKVSTSEKEQTVRALGADLVVNYRDQDYGQAIRNAQGYGRLDVSFNPVAGGTFKRDLSLLNAGGRLILFGGSEMGKAPYGILSKLNFVRKMGLVIPVTLMMGSRNILGVNMLRIADEKPQVLASCLSEVYSLYQENKLKPVVGGKFSWDHLTAAHEFLESGNSMGKIAVFW